MTKHRAKREYFGRYNDKLFIQKAKFIETIVDSDVQQV